ncbi:MAG: hypothetical protein LBD14_00805 [Puniceicoccales bacterium]|jgi:hypothetical protein|nr:hypothetical protein [Puniceicoccales bacterium]
MTPPPRITRLFLATALFPGLTGTPASADPVTPLPTSLEKAATHKIDLAQRATFPPELYPRLDHHAHDEILLAGLAALYPGRILRTPPATLPKPPLPRPSRITRLGGGIEYIRCYTQGIVTANPDPSATARILDLRYYNSTSGTIADALLLCEKYTATLPRVSTIGNYPRPSPAAPDTASPAGNPSPPPVLVLVNHGTAGPIEAMLADLKNRDKIILVGTATAGRTACHQALENHPGWWHITGEIQPADTLQTLVGTGLVPQNPVAVTPDADLLGWSEMERHARSGETALSVPPGDLILRRACDILAALQNPPPVPASPPSHQKP